MRVSRSILPVKISCVEFSTISCTEVISLEKASTVNSAGVILSRKDTFLTVHSNVGDVISGKNFCCIVARKASPQV